MISCLKSYHWNIPLTPVAENTTESTYKVDAPPLTLLRDKFKIHISKYDLVSISH